MIRLTMILLCLMLAGAVAGRYQAEVRVKQLKEDIRALERVKSKELTEIQLLRAEIAYLESPERLAVIAERTTSLAPLTGRQLLSAEEFVAVLGNEDRTDRPAPPSDVDAILHAIAMADASSVTP